MKKLPKIRMVALKKEEKAELVQIKTALWNWMKKNNYSMDNLYAILDQNQDGSITCEEMVARLGEAIGKKQAVVLFGAIDVNRDGRLDMGEVRQELENINAAQVLTTMKETIEAGR